MGKLSKTLIKSLCLSAIAAYSDDNTTEETTNASYEVTGCNDESSPVSLD